MHEIIEVGTSKSDVYGSESEFMLWFTALLASWIVDGACNRIFCYDALNIFDAMRYAALLACLTIFPIRTSTAQGSDAAVFTHADTLQGSLTPQRSWWDVTFYDLHVTVSPSDSSIN